jgi:hypothetical protein
MRYLLLLLLLLDCFMASLNCVVFSVEWYGKAKIKILEEICLACLKFLYRRSPGDTEKTH